MKMKKFRKIFIAFALSLAFLCATFTAGCGEGGESGNGNSGGANAGEKAKVTSAVASFVNDSEIYAEGKIDVNMLRSENLNDGPFKTTENTDVKINFAGAIKYDSAKKDVTPFDLDAYSFYSLKESDADVDPLSYASAFFVRDGLSYAYNLNDYQGYLDGVKAETDKQLKNGGKLDIFKVQNLKDLFAMYIGYKDLDVPASVKQPEAAVKGFLNGFFTGLCALSAITVDGSDYTLDVTQTLCDFVDMGAAVTERAYRMPDATIGEFYDTAEVKAFLSPLLKNVKAQDVIDVITMLSAPSAGVITENAEGKIVVKIGEDMSVTLDKPNGKTLEEYLEKTIFETKINAGNAQIAIKDFKIAVIFGFGQTTDSATSVGFTEEEIAKVAEDIKKSKEDVLEVLPTFKITLTIESGKLTRVRLDMKTVSGGTISSSDNSSDRPKEDGSSTINVRTVKYKNELTIKADVNLLKKAPELLDISKAEKNPPSQNAYL